MAYNPEFCDFTKAQLGITFPYMGDYPLITSSLTIKIEVDGQTRETVPGDYIQFSAPRYLAAHKLLLDAGYGATLVEEQVTYRSPGDGSSFYKAVRIALNVPLQQTQDLDLLGKLKEFIQKTQLEQDVQVIRDKVFKGRKPEEVTALLERIGLKRQEGPAPEKV